MASAALLAVRFDDTPVPAREGMSLFECAEAVGIRVPTSCVKQGKCRECLVEVEEGAELLSAPAPQERHLGGRFRLSCRARIERPGPLRCHTLRRGALRIETETASAQDVALEPAVTRDGDEVRLEGEVLASAPGPLHGLALDIGTTTVALRLVDLESGRVLATQAFENPQRFGGSDVLARIRYDGEQKERILQRTLLAYLSHAILGLPCDPRTIYEVLVVANTTMRDLFFGLDVQPIGQMPYRSRVEEAVLRGERTTTALSARARALRLPVHPAARVVSLPLVGSHVGADAAACLLATGILDSDEVVAVMDIGTNTELLVGNRRRLLAASCPAGPAFEGGGVACGMPALDGAIERVTIGPDGSAALAVIGGAAPQGICGSGLIDLLSELHRTGLMNEQGRLADGADRFPLGGGLYLAEADINELAQAKGAHVAGLRIVLETYGTGFDGLARLYLAGGFARHLDAGAAKRIGLIPDLPDARIVKVGNAALHGATLALKSVPLRRKLEQRVRGVEHVRLETHPRFFDIFVDGCQFAAFGGAGQP